MSEQKERTRLKWDRELRSIWLLGTMRKSKGCESEMVGIASMKLQTRMEMPSSIHQEWLTSFLFYLIVRKTEISDAMTLFGEEHLSISVKRMGNHSM